MIADKNGHPPQARIMIAVPCMDQVQAPFAYSLANMMTHTALTLVGPPPQPIAWLRLMFHQGTLIAPQRRDLAATAIAIDATHILWIDADTTCPKDALNRLLARNKDYVGVNQSGRRPPCGTTAFKRLDTARPTMVYTYPHSTGLEEVHAMGFGLTLCRTEVFRKTPAPWFPMQWGHLPNGEWAFNGEDTGFQEWARKAGFTLWIDHDLSKEIGHMGQFEYRHDHALIQRQAMIEDGRYIIPDDPEPPAEAERALKLEA